MYSLLSVLLLFVFVFTGVASRLPPSLCGGWAGVCVCGDGDRESAGIVTSKAILQTTKEFPDQLRFVGGWRQQPRLNFDVSVFVPPVTQAPTAK